MVNQINARIRISTELHHDKLKRPAPVESNSTGCARSSWLTLINYVGVIYIFSLGSLSADRAAVKYESECAFKIIEFGMRIKGQI